MKTLFAQTARLPDGWAQHVRIGIKDSHIAFVDRDAKALPGDRIVDTLLPALGNLHSHSFQRAMAGLTEHRASGQDSFWTWRTLMYQFIAHMTPDHIQAAAAQTFLEMQEAGFASVGEFHYVHHQADGTPYDQLTELSDRIFAAAQETGIGLTHLPVLYTYGGAGAAPLNDGQRRFGNDVARFTDLTVQARENARKILPADARVGIAPHSLRAITPGDLRAVLDLRGDNPVHIHIAEQPNEVHDIADWLGARPVDWLIDNMPVDQNWCLIHATHMTGAETQKLAQSGAVAGLCPITESNLGDGPFNGVDYLSHGGAFGIGSDSNIRISLTEELRTLEYSQRLRDLSRNRMIPGEGSVGEHLYLAAAVGGAQALGRAAGRIQPGLLADLVAIDRGGPVLSAMRDRHLLDGMIFAADDRVIRHIWSAGRHMVRDGQHINRDRIITRYTDAMTDLMNRIGAR